MEDNLISILESFGYPVFRQGSLTEDEPYPDDFFTFWNNDSSDHSHYNNDEYGTTWDFDVNFYSTDPEKAYSILAEARKKLKEERWITPGRGYDVASDEATHIGRGIEVYFLQI
jgi:hypothetical protein|nr:MAG TPA: Protein of unknown function (DUF3168) [Bacteriophage sp.]